MTTETDVSVVTGASRGIGLAMVTLLLERNSAARVYAVSRRATEEPALQRLARDHGERLHCVAADCALEADLLRLGNDLRTRERRLHRVIHCAGLLHDSNQGLQPEKKLEQVNAAALETLFRINSIAPILLARECLPLLQHDRPSWFVSLSARVGSIGDNHLGGWYGYRASKAAQNQLLRTLAIEARRRAPLLTCLTLHPGTVTTALSQPFRRNIAPNKLVSAEQAAADLLALMARTTPADSGRFLARDGSDIPW